jgi:N-methylhydantoinase B
MNPRNVPVEVHEQKFPILVERLEFIPDSGGAGKFRGGVGIRKDIRALNPMKLINLTDRNKFASYGLFGGKHGSKGSTKLKRGSEWMNLHSKGVYDINPEEVVSFSISGGGGYEDPMERDVQRVLKDVMGGYISIEGARRDYGVTIDSQTMTVRFEETEKIRQNKGEKNVR